MQCVHYTKATIPPTGGCFKNIPVQQISIPVQILSILHFISFNSYHSIECTEKKPRAQSKKTIEPTIAHTLHMVFIKESFKGNRNWVLISLPTFKSKVYEAAEQVYGVAVQVYGV